MTFEGSSTVNFTDNYADGNGGVVYIGVSYSYFDIHILSLYSRLHFMEALQLALLITVLLTMVV